MSRAHEKIGPGKNKEVLFVEDFFILALANEFLFLGEEMMVREAHANIV